MSDKWVEIALTVFLAAIIGLLTWVDKIDDRQYENAQKYATKEELKDAVNDLRDEVDIRFRNSEKNQHLIIELMKERRDNGS